MTRAQIRPSAERLVKAGSPAGTVDLCVQTFGAETDPAVLLLAGSTSSMLSWDDEFCGRLAGAGRLVIRGDYRDTGRSTNYPPGEPGYGFTELVEDAVGTLDELGVARAHMVGMSMGGMIAQVLGIEFADRVRTLTLMSTSPGGAGPHNPDLSTMSEKYQAEYQGVKMPKDWSDLDSVVDYCVDILRPCVSKSRPFDEDAARDYFARAMRRTNDRAASMINHFAMDKGDPWRQNLAKIGAPTLIVHGGEDPVHPFDHAEALLREIPGATMQRLDQAGHELDRRDYDTIIGALVEHTA